MALVVYYFLFALSIAIACCIEYFWPAVSEAKALGVQNEFSEHPLLSCFVWITLSTIIAPVLVPIYFSNGMSAGFKKAVRDTVISDE